MEHFARFAAPSIGHTGTGPLHLVLTVPVYNEVARLSSCIQTLDAAAYNWGFRTTIIVAEDGSTDGTKNVLPTLSTTHSKLVVLSDSERRGRGYALRRAWRAQDADVFAFTDADLPGGTEAIRRTVMAIAWGADVATASRYAPGAVTHRPPFREMVSRFYNRMTRVLFQEFIDDHQCGIKAFAGHVKEFLIEQTREDSWFWDTEVLVVATRHGLTIEEIPVTWTETRYHRTPIPRLLRDVALHGTGLMRLFVNLNRVPYSCAPERGSTVHGDGRRGR